MVCKCRNSALGNVQADLSVSSTYPVLPTYLMVPHFQSPHVSGQGSLPEQMAEDAFPLTEVQGRLVSWALCCPSISSSPERADNRKKSLVDILICLPLEGFVQIELKSKAITVE